MLTIVMYHYVRDLRLSRYPRIKGLDTAKFDGQLDYITKHYNVVSLADVIAAARSNESLPPNACALTFDDGFIDHYTNVLPRLDAKRIQGSFFPSACCIEEHVVLDVHKIHFVLASREDHEQLARDVLDLLEQYRTEHGIPDEETLLRDHGMPGRFDPPETAFVKRILQWGLPKDVRNEVVDRLFHKYVTADEAAFAQELYVDVPQLRTMYNCGMEIGGHGLDHSWLGTLDRASQREQLLASREFLGRIEPRLSNDWLMCYPHGSYDRTTVELLEELEGAIGLTCEVSLVHPNHSLLELPRINTNDLPCDGSARLNDWTLQAYGRSERKACA
ncbi:MAG: polysaccharide deacetylase family protein [Planctomycetota bacterium]